MSPLTLAQKILAIDAALAEIAHAFGGALALAYYAEPRATIDVDLNVFVPTTRFDTVAAPLVALGVGADDPSVAELARRDGQVRVMWDATPIDLFFAYDAFHDAAGAARRIVPFADRSIPILAPEHLVVCKAVLTTPRSIPPRCSAGWVGSPATTTLATSAWRPCSHVVRADEMVGMLVLVRRHLPRGRRPGSVAAVPKELQLRRGASPRFSPSVVGYPRRAR